MKDMIIKTIFSLMLFSIWIGCSNPGFEDSNQLLNSTPSILDKLPEKVKNDFFSSLEVDENNKVIGFRYIDVRNEMGMEKDYYRFILDFLDVKRVQYISNTKSKLISLDKHDELQIMTLKNAYYNNGGGDPIIFEDKKNYRKPGCKPAGGYVCVIRKAFPTQSF